MIVEYKSIERTNQMATTPNFKTTARDFNGIYSDIYFSKGIGKTHCFYQCPTTRVMVDIVKIDNKYSIILENMDTHTEDRLVRPTLKSAKESAMNYLNSLISKSETLEVIEETEINLDDIIGIDIIDQQLFADDNIDNIVGIDLIDSQLFSSTAKLCDVDIDIDIDDLVEELDDNNWLTSYALNAIDNLLPIGFMVLKSNDDLLKIFGRNTIARVLIGGESKLNVIWHNESLPGINIDTVIEIINDIINDPDDLLFGKGIKVELV